MIKNLRRCFLLFFLLSISFPASDAPAVEPLKLGIHPFLAATEL
jgi:hypothetical protein